MADLSPSPPEVEDPPVLRAVQVAPEEEEEAQLGEEEEEVVQEVVFVPDDRAINRGGCPPNPQLLCTHIHKYICPSVQMMMSPLTCLFAPSCPICPSVMCPLTCLFAPSCPDWLLRHVQQRAILRKHPP